MRMLPPPSPSLALSVIRPEAERGAAEPRAVRSRECENRGLRGGGGGGGGARGGAEAEHRPHPAPRPRPSARPDPEADPEGFRGVKKSALAGRRVPQLGPYSRPTAWGSSKMSLQPQALPRNLCGPRTLRKCL